jgi:urease accessory protein
MGEFPARIVAQDFLTPPELAAWQLAGEDAGRIGGARFTLQSRGGATYLANLYEQIPIRVLPLNLGSTEPTLIYLLNPTNGLMDGDAHRLEIHAGPGTRSVVTGQSATRIHPCLKGFCTQQWRVTVADGAILVVLPGPAIPFAGCRFFQRVDIDLDKNAQLIWGDLWFAGRYARQEASERFRFDRIVQEMRIRREGQLVYRDRFCWHGPWDDETARWHFGDAPAAGTLFATGARLSNNNRIPRRGVHDCRRRYVLALDGIFRRRHPRSGGKQSTPRVRNDGKFRGRTMVAHRPSSRANPLVRCCLKSSQLTALGLQPIQDALRCP